MHIHWWMGYASEVAHRTTIEIDERRLAAAREVLGTHGIKDTVDRALDEVVRAALRRRLSERLATQQGVDFSTELLDRIRPIR
ncbi:MAG: type II toxin-antitoxin system VapB family antitoxin [Acidimicrobiales bacterium]